MRVFESFSKFLRVFTFSLTRAPDLWRWPCCPLFGHLDLKSPSICPYPIPIPIHMVILFAFTSMSTVWLFRYQKPFKLPIPNSFFRHRFTYGYIHGKKDLSKGRNPHRASSGLWLPFFHFAFNLSFSFFFIFRFFSSWIYL